MLALALTTLLASHIDYEKKEINMKLIYVSADEAVATANLEYVYAKTSPDAGPRARPERSAAGGYYSFLPLTLGEIRGFKTRFHLYTMGTGKAYEKDRRQVMKGTDGVVFIADKDAKKSTANIAALAQLKADLAANGYDPAAMVIVYQAVGQGDVALLRKSLGLKPETVVFEADPASGTGVFDTMKAAAKGMLMALRNGASDAGK